MRRVLYPTASPAVFSFLAAGHDAMARQHPKNPFSPADPPEHPSRSLTASRVLLVHPLLLRAVEDERHYEGDQDPEVGRQLLRW